MKKVFNYFTLFETLLFLGSACLILSTFFIFGGQDYITPFASLFGVFALILCAKGNPIGLIMMMAFAIFYGIISLSQKYYGELLTYMGMSLPMNLVSLISWLKNPSKKGKKQVKVASITKKEIIIMCVLALVVTIGFYFILRWLGTANLVVSTISVATSFSAVYLVSRRSPYFAIAYALNDIVLIVLWVLASIKDLTYLSVVACFAVFLINDTYSFINWKKMQKTQE